MWDGIKNEIETINSSKKGEYGKDFMKVKFNKDDNLPLNKPLNLHLLTITVRCIFEEDGKFYPQLYVDDYVSIMTTLCISYMLQTTYKCWNTIELIFQKELMLIKQMYKRM